MGSASPGAIRESGVPLAYIYARFWSHANRGGGGGKGGGGVILFSFERIRNSPESLSRSARSFRETESSKIGGFDYAGRLQGWNVANFERVKILVHWDAEEYALKRATRERAAFLSARVGSFAWVYFLFLLFDLTIFGVEDAIFTSFSRVEQMVTRVCPSCGDA